MADPLKYPRILAADVGPELSDAEILERFGPLFEEADRAWRADPEYLTVLGEAAGQAATAPGAAERRERQRLSENRQQAREERREAVIRLWQKGLSNPAIAAQLGESVGAVGYILQTAGLRRKRQAQRSRAHHDSVTGLWREGLTRLEIAERLGLSESTVSRVLRTAGLKRAAKVSRKTIEPRRGIAERDALITDLLRRGFTQREIAKAVGCSNTAISACLKVLRGADTSM